MTASIFARAVLRIALLGILFGRFYTFIRRMGFDAFQRKVVMVSITRPGGTFIRRMKFYVFHLKMVMVSITRFGR